MGMSTAALVNRQPSSCSFVVALAQYVLYHFNPAGLNVSADICAITNLLTVLNILDAKQLEQALADDAWQVMLAAKVRLYTYSLPYILFTYSIVHM